MPSGYLRPSLTIVFRSDPSAFAASTRPAPRSKKKRWPESESGASCVVRSLEAVGGIGLLSFSRCDAISYVHLSIEWLLFAAHQVHRVRTRKCSNVLPQTVGAFGVANRHTHCASCLALSLHPHLHESAQPRDGLTNNHVLHLIRTFIGVERFRIGEKA